MRRLVGIWGAVFLFAAHSGPARAEFIPGRIYVSTGPMVPIPELPKIVWEFDPATGKHRRFAEMLGEHRTGYSGGAFTPDGLYLLHSTGAVHRIQQIDADGNPTFTLGPEDGLFHPSEINYDRWGNLFVMNGGTSQILRYPAAGGPPSVFADEEDDIGPGGSFAIGPSGDVYYTRRLNRITHITREGVGSLFATFANRDDIGDLVVDSQSNLFAVVPSGVHRFEGGDPEDVSVITEPLSAGRHGELAFSPNEDLLYIEIGTYFWSVPPNGGELRFLGDIPQLGEYGTSRGMSVYVPEPNSLMLLAIPLLIGRRR